MNDRSASRILVVTSTYPLGVGEAGPRFVHELCRRLAKSGLAIDVLAPGAAGADAEDRIEGVRVFRYRYFLRRWESLAYGGGIVPNVRENPLKLLLVPFLLAGMILALRRRIRLQRYDAVHAHWILPQGLCVALALGKRALPVLLTAHGTDVLSLNGRLPARLKRYALDRSTAVTAVSSHLRDELLSGFAIPHEKISVAPMGVDLDTRFTVDRQVRRRPDRILYVGRLNEAKGLPHLMEAFASMRRQRNDLELQIVGDGPSGGPLRSLAERLGVADAVRFAGSIAAEELPDIYRAATVFVLPSLQEGLGLVLIEAIGCGCPVVASDLPATRDIVAHEHTGLLVAPGRSDAIAAAVSRQLDDPQRAQEMADAAREHAVRRFDWRIAAQRYDQILRRMIASEADRSGAPDG